MNEWNEARQALIALVFSLPRMLAAFTLLPVFSQQLLPGMTRNSVAVSLALLALPIVMVDAPMTTPGWAEGLAITLKEIVIGLLIGFGAAIPFWVIDSTGFFIDNQRGTTMASSVDPMTGAQTSPLGILLTQTLVVIFFVGGGLLMFLGALYESYRLWPVFSFFPHLNSAVLPHLLGLLDRVMGLTVLLAAPVIIAMFMTEFAMGLISRFTPQMNVFSLAMPIKSAVGILILVLYMTLLFTFLDQELLEINLHFTTLSQWFQ
ncbi:MAG: type III secretion system export apparatus subunit SctT [Candidatus Competibacteraceae bacterium]